jgi:cell division protein FtsB
MSEQQEQQEKKVVSRNVAIVLGIICILLIATIGYFVVTNISAQNSYNNLRNQNEQLQSWLDGNETLLGSTRDYNTYLQNRVNELVANLNLNTSSICTYNNTKFSLPVFFGDYSGPAGTYALFLNAHDEINTGVVVVHVSSDFDIYVTITFKAYGYVFINERHLGMNGTAAFATLPTLNGATGISIEVYTNETAIPASAKVTIIYYY